MGIFDIFKKKEDIINEAGESKWTGVMSEIRHYVSLSISYEDKGDIPHLQNALYQMTRYLNGIGKGVNVVNYPEHGNLGMCYAFLLKYDWENDSDLREVAVENGLYCIMTYMRHESNKNTNNISQALFILFLLLAHGGDSLEKKVSSILNKAKYLNSSVFSNEDYEEGGEYVIRQILFLAFSGMRGYVQEHKDMWSHYVDSDQNFCVALTLCKLSPELKSISPISIMKKTEYISSIIGNILLTT